MMTYEEILAKAEALGYDADVTEYEDDRQIAITFNDFDGFDDDWCEVMRDYDDAEAVEAFEEMLKDEALEVEDDFYTVYHFDGFDVVVGYASYDI